MRPMIALSRALFLAGATLLLVTSCSRMTEENRVKVQNGMTVPEVEDILGSPTTDESQSPLGVVTLTIFHYKTGNDDVTVRFLNGKVTEVLGDFSK
jgi:hypothetical protein